MEKQFLTTLKKKSHRERFYSSMTYDQYYDVYGPPAPLFKPQDDPVEEIPMLDLEAPLLTSQTKDEPEPIQLSANKMETIYEIEGSENFSQNLLKSPRNDFFSSGRKSRETLGTGDVLQAPKRVRIRARCQSDNSQYLIFNFLERANQKQDSIKLRGHKKIKRQ